jgi:hypothetical protein
LSEVDPRGLARDLSAARDDERRRDAARARDRHRERRRVVRVRGAQRGADRIGRDGQRGLDAGRLELDVERADASRTATSPRVITMPEASITRARRRAQLGADG